MFEMNDIQKKAAENAMNGASIMGFSHAILYGIALSAVLWFLWVLFGVYQKLQLRKIDIGDALGMMGMAAFILICTGTLIHY
jgi:hypothetical protein